MTYKPKLGHPLSRKQAAIMDQVCEGKKTGEIVEVSGMAKGTVHMHLERIKDKLGAKTTTQAAVLWDRLKRSIY